MALAPAGGPGAASRSAARARAGGAAMPGAARKGTLGNPQVAGIVTAVKRQNATGGGTAASRGVFKTSK